MMKKYFAVSILFVSVFLTSCWKNEPKLGGRVITARGGDLVPHARVVFLGAESDDNLLTPMSYYKLGETVSDALGHFEIPDNEQIEFIMAIPPNDEEYTDYRAEFWTASYFDKGGIFECMVEAASWVRLSAVDVEPLNPGGVIRIALYDANNNYVKLDEQFVAKTGSNKSYTKLYWLEVNGEYQYMGEVNTPVLQRGDTLDYVIEY